MLHYNFNLHCLIILILKAVAYDANGNELDTYTVTTPGAAAKVVATANRTEIDANNSDLVYVEVDVTDANGNLVTTATNNLTFTVEGPAEIAAVDNGDQAGGRCEGPAAAGCHPPVSGY